LCVGIVYYGVSFDKANTFIDVTTNKRRLLQTEINTNLGLIDSQKLKTGYIQQCQYIGVDNRIVQQAISQSNTEKGLDSLTDNTIEGLSEQWRWVIFTILALFISMFFWSPILMFILGYCWVNKWYQYNIQTVINIFMFYIIGMYKCICCRRMLMFCCCKGYNRDQIDCMLIVNNNNNDNKIKYHKRLKYGLTYDIDGNIIKYDNSSRAVIINDQANLDISELL